MLSPQEYHSSLTESAIAWWRDAGVDYVCDDETVNWLAPVASVRVAEKVTEPVQSRAAPAAVQSKISVPSAPWPQDIAALKSAISAGAALPGCGYGTLSISPIGEMGANTMIIGDSPEDEEIAAEYFGAGIVSKLLENMLFAAGILPDLTYRTALAHSRPVTGSIPKDDLPTLAAFARHQIALVQPKIIILFGSAACEALLSQDLMKARGNLHYINHDDRKTAAVATFHPRTVLAQPQLKAQAWKDLQMLTRKDYL